MAFLVAEPAHAHSAFALGYITKTDGFDCEKEWTVGTNAMNSHSTNFDIVFA